MGGSHGRVTWEGLMTPVVCGASCQAQGRSSNSVNMSMLQEVAVIGMDTWPPHCLMLALALVANLHP